MSLYSVGLHTQPYQSRVSGYPTLQCFITYEGKGIFKLRSGQDVILDKDNVLFVPKDYGHEYYSILESPWVVGYIGIGGKLAEDITVAYGLPLATAITLKPAARPIVHDKLLELWTLADRSSFNQTALLSVKLYEFLLLISEMKAKSQTFDHTSARQSDQALKRAVHYLHEHFNEPLLMSNVAQAVGYSVQHFQRMFKQNYGISPHAYLQRIRLQQAADWLEEDRNHSIIDIAARLGMDANYFIRIFKKEYGLSPGAFRNHIHANRKKGGYTP